MIQGSNIKIKANGISICYDDFGKGKTPIIFIHGFPFDKSMWQPQMDFFKHTRRVIALDIRGFGLSSNNSEKESIDLLALDLIVFMDSLKIPKAIVCGLSMGGYIVLNAFQNYADRFEAVILSDTQSIADSAEQKAKRQETIVGIKTNGLDPFIERTIENIFCIKTLDSNKDLVENIRHIMRSTCVSSIIAGLTALEERADMTFVLNQIKVPTLILCGNEDIVTPFVQSDFMFSKIKNAKIFSIENAGHLSNIEQPTVFNQLLSDFMIGLKSESQKVVNSVGLKIDDSQAPKVA
jgi:3-oxoadipate enol-lactonase